MTRADVETKVCQVLKEEFEIENPDLDGNFAESYEFDSVDALNLLGSIEEIFDLDQPLSVDEEREVMKLFMKNCTLGDFIDFLVEMFNNRQND